MSWNGIGIGIGIGGMMPVELRKSSIVNEPENDLLH